MRFCLTSNIKSTTENYTSGVIKWVCQSICTHKNPGGILKWPYAKSPGWQPTLCVAWCLICWFALVYKKYGHTWHRMSLLRPDVIKQHKPPLKSGFDILLHYTSWLVYCLYHFICTANLFKISTTVSYGSHHHAKHKIMIIKPILNFAASKPKLRHLARITHMHYVCSLSVFHHCECQPKPLSCVFWWGNANISCAVTQQMQGIKWCPVRNTITEQYNNHNHRIILYYWKVYWTTS